MGSKKILASLASSIILTQAALGEGFGGLYEDPKFLECVAQARPDLAKGSFVEAWRRDKAAGKYQADALVKLCGLFVLSGCKHITHELVQAEAARLKDKEQSD